MGKKKKSNLMLHRPKRQALIRKARKDILLYKSPYKSPRVHIDITHKVHKWETPKFEKGKKRMLLRSPCTKTFTPSKSPHLKRFRRLAFENDVRKHDTVEAGTGGNTGPPEYVAYAVKTSDLLQRDTSFIGNVMADNWTEGPLDTEFGEYTVNSSDFLKDEIADVGKVIVDDWTEGSLEPEKAENVVNVSDFLKDEIADVGKVIVDDWTEGSLEPENAENVVNVSDFLKDEIADVGKVIVDDWTEGSFMLENAENTVNISDLPSPAIKPSINNAEFTNISMSHDRNLSELKRLLPIVVNALKAEGMGNVLLDFFREVETGVFPLNNIAFLLWAEVVKWYKHDNSSAMRYSTETKQFWKLGWQLFGGKFLRFMSGFKNTTQIVTGDASKGKCETRKSEVNFVIPGENNLRTFQSNDIDTHGVRKPGIFSDVMKRISDDFQGKSACVTFDGKKIKQGLTSATGDIDLIGFEKGPSLTDRRTALYDELNAQHDVLSIFDRYHSEMQTSDLSEEDIEKVTTDLKRIHVNVSVDVHDIKEIKQKKEYARKKFVEKGGENWRHGKFVYVISAIDAFIFDINNYLMKVSQLISNICRSLVSLQQSEELYSSCDLIHIHERSNFVPLPVEPETQDTRKIRQRTEKWFQVRKKAKVTGSTLYKAIGLDGLKQLQQHFDRVICGVDEPKHTPEVEKNLKYGTEHEVDAIATLIGRVLPVVSPDLDFHEEGCIAIPNIDDPFIVVSPDGSLYPKCSSEINPVVAVELKCPVFKVHDKFPNRYVLQCLCEMEALDVDQLLYLSWRPDISTVFRLRRDKVLFKAAIDLAKMIYSSDKPKRPTKLPEETRILKKMIEEKSKNAEFLGEFLSVRNLSEGSIATDDITVNDRITLDTVTELYKDIAEVTKLTYELKRQKATEALVFLCCDLDRIWTKREIIWSPVCWCSKGYSLTTEVMRNLMEAVLDQCALSGIHVPASSFDGQWHNICVRDSAGNPLTLYQLHKDVWKEVQKLSKCMIEKELKGITIRPQWTYEFAVREVNETRMNAKFIVCTNGGIHLPKTPARGWVRKEKQAKAKKSNAESESTENDLPITDVLPDNVIEAVQEGEITHSDMLAAYRDRNMVEEIASCNVSDETWISVLESIQENTDEEDVDMDETIITSSRVENDKQLSTAAISDLTMHVTYEAAATILAMLKTDTTANKKGKWQDKGTSDVVDMLSSKIKLQQARDCDLKIVLRYLKQNANFKVKESVSKSSKIEFIAEKLGINEDLQSTNSDANISTNRSHKQFKQVKSLKVLSSTALKRVPKTVLNIAYAEYVWPKKRDEWFESSTILNGSSIGGLNEPSFWFYHPEFSPSRQQLEVRCIDSTHLLTRSRRKTCHGGIEKLTNDPWLKVAKKGQTFLTPVMVSDIIDPMSMSMAVTHFSEPVQEAMRNNGDLHAASLCEDILSWWRAEDEPGIPAMDRVKLRLQLRYRLLKAIDFDQFPTPVMYINGWPAQLWEALLANIDAKALLYSLCKTGTYNTRAFSSMMGETFFSELTHQDRSSHGTVSAGEFGRFIGKTIEQMQVRLDPDRVFHYRTSKCKAYRLVEADKSTEDNVQDHWEVFDCTTLRRIEKVLPRDHQFDSEERKLRKGRRKLGTVSKDRNSLQKGDLGVRWNVARRNEGKMLLTKKIGIE